MRKIFVMLVAGVTALAVPAMLSSGVAAAPGFGNSGGGGGGGFVGGGGGFSGGGGGGPRIGNFNRSPSIGNYDRGPRVGNFDRGFRPGSPNWGKGNGHHGRYGRRHFRGYPYFAAYPQYYSSYSYGYSNNCAWLKRKAIRTGSRYWWDRYEDCKYGY